MLFLSRYSISVGMKGDVLVPAEPVLRRPDSVTQRSRLRTQIAGRSDGPKGSIAVRSSRLPMGGESGRHPPPRHTIPLTASQNPIRIADEANPSTRVPALRTMPPP